MCALCLDPPCASVLAKIENVLFVFSHVASEPTYCD